MVDGPLLLPAPKKAKKQIYRGNNAFGALGISPDASTAEIKRAYIRLARQYHPDLNHSPDAKKEFIRISRAYEYIMKHGELLRLQLKCDMVEVKVGYVEFLRVHKRAKVLAGIEPDPPPFNAAYVRRDELGQKMQRLGSYMMFECPACKLRASCNRATGFEEVEDIHHEIRAKIMARFFGRG
jgi:hypothetical protein